MSICNRNIVRALELAEKMIRLSEEGEADAEDDGCVLLYGIVRDCAYKIRAQARQERETHIERGVWREPDEGELKYDGNVSTNDRQRKE
jgi:hypothetical protein